MATLPPAPSPPSKSNELHDPAEYSSVLEEPFTMCIVTLYLVIGISFVTCGYRCFKSSLFSSGFCAGTAIIFCICMHESILSTYGGDDSGVFSDPTVRRSTVAAMCAAAGLLLGLASVLAERAGLAALGAQAGLLAGGTALAAYDVLVVDRPPATYWYCVTVLMMSGVCGAASILYYKKGLTIIYTSMYGAAMVAICADYFLERFAMVYWVLDRVRLAPSGGPAGAWPWPWPQAALAAWPAGAALGALLQALCPGPGPPPPVRRPRPPAEVKQHRYRHLHQLRTAHGDVISQQSYVQALQHKPGDPWGVAGAGAGARGPLSTLQSDCTHVTVLASEDDRRAHCIRRPDSAVGADART